jgi:hypothetical protein
MTGSTHERELSTGLAAKLLTAEGKTRSINRETPARESFS